MHVDVALETVGEFREYRLSMGFCMTLFAFWNISVFGMTLDTAYLPVPAGGRLYLVVSFCMTRAAYVVFH